MTNTNTGHGHVFKRPDGVYARCGGPGLCHECSADAAKKRVQDADAAELEQMAAASPLPDQAAVATSTGRPPRSKVLELASKHLPLTSGPSREQLDAFANELMDAMEATYGPRHHVLRLGDTVEVSGDPAFGLNVCGKVLGQPMQYRVIDMAKMREAREKEKPWGLLP